MESREENIKDLQIEEKNFILEKINTKFFENIIEKKIELIDYLVNYYLKTIKEKNELNEFIKNNFHSNIEKELEKLEENKKLLLKNREKIEKLNEKIINLPQINNELKSYNCKINKKIQKTENKIKELESEIKKNDEKYDEITVERLEDEKTFTYQNPKDQKSQELHAELTYNTIKRLQDKEKEHINEITKIKIQQKNKLEQKIKEYKAKINSNNDSIRKNQEESVNTKKEAEKIKKEQEEIEQNIKKINNKKLKKEELYRKKQQEIQKNSISSIRNYKLELEKHTFFICEFMKKLKSFKQNNNFFIKEFKKIIKNINNSLEQYLTNDNYEPDLSLLHNTINNIIKNENFKVIYKKQDENQNKITIQLSNLDLHLQKVFEINSKDIINLKLIINYFSKIIENEPSYLIEIQKNKNDIFFVKMNKFEKLEENEQSFLNFYQYKNKITNWEKNKDSKKQKIFFNIKDKEKQNHYCLIFLKKPENKIEKYFINLSNPELLKVPNIFFNKSKHYEKCNICLEEPKKFLKLQKKILSNKKFHNLEKEDIKLKFKNSDFTLKIAYYYNLVIQTLGELEEMQAFLEKRKKFVKDKIKDISNRVHNKKNEFLKLQISSNTFENDDKIIKNDYYSILNITEILMGAIKIFIDEIDAVEPEKYDLILANTSNSEKQTEFEQELIIKGENLIVCYKNINDSINQEYMNLNEPQPSTSKSTINLN